MEFICSLDGAGSVDLPSDTTPPGTASARCAVLQATTLTSWSFDGEPWVQVWNVPKPLDFSTSRTEPLRASGFSSGLISTTVHSRQRWPSFQPCSFGQNAQT